MVKLDDLHRGRPIVGHAECHSSVQRLKAGPVDIQAVLDHNELFPDLKYYDTSFYGHESLYWEEQLYDDWYMYDYDEGLEDGRYFFKRWPTMFPDSALFSNEEGPIYTDVI